MKRTTEEDLKQEVDCLSLLYILAVIHRQNDVAFLEHMGKCSLF